MGVPCKSSSTNTWQNLCVTMSNDVQPLVCDNLFSYSTYHFRTIVSFQNTTPALLTYSNGKWQASTQENTFDVDLGKPNNLTISPIMLQLIFPFFSYTLDHSGNQTWQWKIFQNYFHAGSERWESGKMWCALVSAEAPVRYGLRPGRRWDRNIQPVLWGTCGELASGNESNIAIEHRL